MKKTVHYEKNRIFRYLKKLILDVFMCGVIMAIAGMIMFYLLVISGLFPKAQSLWVCSAMGTMHHQWLATAFLPDEKVEAILEAERVNDHGYSTNTDEIDIPDTSDTPDDGAEALPPEQDAEDVPEKPEEEIPEKEPEPVDIYVEQGYEKLEEGLYLKAASGSGWRGWLMLISDPKRVRVEDTRRQFNCGQKVSQMVKNAGAVAGINGGGFTDGPNYDSNGGTPSGVVIENGILVYPTDPELIENAVYNMVGMTSDGILVLRQCTPKWAIENDIVSAVSFKPYIIVNGKGLVREGTTGGWGIAPRTAIGQRKTGEIIFMVVDGRQPGYSTGCDLLPLQETLLAEGCHNAAMMDGGSSTVMIYNDEFVNKPSLGFERYINNSWVVMPIENTDEDITDEQ